MLLKTQTVPHGYGLLTLGSINQINSVPSFGTDQTVVQGLNQPKHLHGTSSKNKTQVGRNPYVKEFEEKLPNSCTNAKSSPRRSVLLLVPKTTDGRIAHDSREKFLSLRKPLQKWPLDRNSGLHVFFLGLMKEKTL